MNGFSHIFIYNKITRWAALDSHLIFFFFFFPDSGLPRRMQFPWDHGESEDLKGRRDATDGKRMTASPELIQLLDVVRCDDCSLWTTITASCVTRWFFVSNHMVNVLFSSHSLNLSLRSGLFCVFRSVNSPQNKPVFWGRLWHGCWSDMSLSQSASVVDAAAHMTDRPCLCHYLPFKSSVNLLNNGICSLTSGMDDSSGLLVGQSTILLQIHTTQRHIEMTAAPRMTDIKTLLQRISCRCTRHHAHTLLLQLQL